MSRSKAGSRDPEKKATYRRKQATKRGLTMSRPGRATRARPSYAPTGTQRTNNMAIWSLILSIIWLGGLGSVAGVALGIAADAISR